MSQITKMWQEAAAAPADPKPDAHLTTTDFDQHTKRNFWVTLTGSLNDFQRGTTQAVWHHDAGCEHIYQRIAGMEGGKPIYEGDTSKAVILGLKLLSVSSNFPVDIGAVITGVHGKTYCANGKNYAFIAEAGKYREANSCIFEPQSKVTRGMLQQYNDTSPAKMESHCFHGQDGETLVDNQSPLALMLRLNSEVLNMTFGLGQGDVGFLKVDTNIVKACLQRYEEDQKVNFIDKNNFRIDFERVDGQLWAAPEGVIDNLRSNQRGNNGHVASQRLVNTYTVKALIEEELVLYGNKKQI